MSTTVLMRRHAGYLQVQVQVQVLPTLGIMRGRLHVMTSVFCVFVSFSCFQEDNTFAGGWFYQLISKKVFFSIPLVRLPRIYNRNFNYGMVETVCRRN